MKDCIKRTVEEHWSAIPLFFITTFAFGYQAIPFFTWLFIPNVLIYTRNKPYYNIIIAYIVSSCALSLGYLGNFKATDEGPRFPLTAAVVASSFIINSLLVAALFADRFIITHNQFIYTRVFVFPTIWTALWFLFGRFGPLGDYPAFSTSLVHWADFSQAASLGGRATLDFLIALSGTITLELPNYPLRHIISAHPSGAAQTLLIDSPMDQEDSNEDNLHTVPLYKRQRIALLLHPVTIYSFIMLLIFTYGGIGINIRRGSFYQTSYPKYIPKTTPVGCVVGASELFPDLTWNQDVWFNKTIELAEAGAKLVIWSELTTNIQNEADEKDFIERAKRTAIKYNTYIGVTYALIEPVRKNKFVFVTKQGEIGIDYNKAHPVPMVELQPAGPKVLQYVDTEEFGRIGAGICFDYNFPDFIKQASTYKVDVMLQPSWTWGPIGTLHQQGNILRAVENGFTLFRCVSQGVSGIYEPTLNGVFNQKVASNNVEKYIFYLPLQKRINTLYGYIGDSFSYLCIISSIGLLLFAYRKSRNSNNQQLSI